MRRSHLLGRTVAVAVLLACVAVTQVGGGPASARPIPRDPPGSPGVLRAQTTADGLFMANLHGSRPLTYDTTDQAAGWRQCPYDTAASDGTGFSAFAAFGIRPRPLWHSNPNYNLVRLGEATGTTARVLYTLPDATPNVRYQLVVDYGLLSPRVLNMDRDMQQASTSAKLPCKFIDAAHHSEAQSVNFLVTNSEAVFHYYAGTTTISAAGMNPAHLLSSGSYDQSTVLAGQHSVSAPFTVPCLMNSRKGGCVYTPFVVLEATLYPWLVPGAPGEKHDYPNATVSARFVPTFRWVPPHMVAPVAVCLVPAGSGQSCSPGAAVTPARGASSKTVSTVRGTITGGSVKADGYCGPHAYVADVPVNPFQSNKVDARWQIDGLVPGAHYALSEANPAASGSPANLGVHNCLAEGGFQDNIHYHLAGNDAHDVTVDMENCQFPSFTSLCYPVPNVALGVVQADGRGTIVVGSDTTVYTADDRNIGKQVACGLDPAGCVFLGPPETDAGSYMLPLSITATETRSAPGGPGHVSYPIGSPFGSTASSARVPSAAVAALPVAVGAIAGLRRPFARAAHPSVGSKVPTTTEPRPPAKPPVPRRPPAWIMRNRFARHELS